MIARRVWTSVAGPSGGRPRRRARGGAAPPSAAARRRRPSAGRVEHARRCRTCRGEMFAAVARHAIACSVRRHGRYTRGLDPCVAPPQDRPSRSTDSTKEVDQMYRMLGLHARAAAPLAAPPGAGGQGTVEYVALILLVALVMAGVVAAMKGFRTDEGKELGDVDHRQDQGGGEEGAVLRRRAERRARVPAARAAAPPLPTIGRRGARERTAARRRVRLRRRRPDRPARVPRVAAARGLPLPRRHRPLPVRRPHARASCSRSRASSRASCSSAGAKLLVVACNSATAAALPALRDELEGRVPVVGRRHARVAPRRGRDAQRARRPARHARDRRQRRLRARARRGRRPTPSCTRSRAPSWRR